MGSAGKKTGASSRTDMHFRAKVRKKGEVRGVHPFLAHSGGCASLVGADVVKNSGYEWKPGGKGCIGDVRRVHVLVENVHRKVRGIFIPHCNALSSFVYKRREGSVVKGLPI